MALSLLARNIPKLRGFAALPRCTFRIQKAQNFTQLVVSKNTNSLSLANKCKIQFVNVGQQAKRNMSGDHGKIWTIEKIISFLLLGLVPATFLYPNNILDNAFAVACVLHFHWGLEACVIDYARPIVVGPILSKIAIALLYVVSATTLGALIYFNQTQIGIGCALRDFWSITGTAADNQKSAK
ncbi:unnamed protein product [Ceutorhynchus assimilis]|uniref:Succinate dehydrogenase [ubiquinone] cytochrome b small subunit n=1 Tax=Ceutorhynchus assimilis TaxID=467358 RepID=A0A9N9MLN0_9CUCU|nr:unnamed protein product [Ceutorhynchus assimilis]